MKQLALIRKIGVSKVARAVGVSRQTVSQWVRVPPEYCVAIEAIAEGVATRYDLRPDVFGKAPARSSNKGREAA